MNSRLSSLTIAVAVAASAASLAAQSQINGAGATFPNPIYTKWFSEYNKLHPDVRINYQSVGSGAGIRQLTNRTVFFGATDGPMTEDQLLAAPGKILHFPTVLGSVVPIYKVAGVADGLKFTGPVLANIFMGTITKWNDPQIASINPGVNLPPTDITVVHRSDGSGTTYVWIDYLAKVSPEVGTHRRPEVRRGARVLAAAEAGRRSRDEGAGENQDPIAIAGQGCVGFGTCGGRDEVAP